MLTKPDGMSWADWEVFLINLSRNRSRRKRGLLPGGAAPGPAPSGFRWEFVTSNGERVTSDGEPVVALVGT